ncbi:MAG: glutamate-1-semialdehyde 2,1-aminomutase, partial [Actinomycetota bacterium]
GNRYLDWVLSWGPLLFGHADRETVEAVREAALRGTSFGAPTEAEVELAAEIVDAVPSVDRVRLVSSGTEAAMSAIRLARAFTKRDRVIKFAGCYHGHLDALLVQAGSGVATLGLPGSAGVTPGTVADTIIVPYNDVAALEAALDAHGSEIAAVLVEPIAANMGLVAPTNEFLRLLRAGCTRHGALLVLDEVITGFRVGLGGAQARYGVIPDLSIFGKVIGGGLPLAAVGGSAAIMDELAPLGPVYQAGTLSGNPLATAAGLAVLAELDHAAYNRLARTAERLEDGLRKVFADAGVVAQVTRAFTLLGVFFADAPVDNYEAARNADHLRYAQLFHALLERGVYFAPSGYETLFPSLAHSEADVDETIEAAVNAAVDAATR